MHSFVCVHVLVDILECESTSMYIYVYRIHIYDVYIFMLNCTYVLLRANVSLYVNKWFGLVSSFNPLELSIDI